MDPKAVVAILLAGVVLLGVGMRGFLAYLHPDVAINTDSLKLWMDLFNTIAGGLLVYIGTRGEK